MKNTTILRDALRPSGNFPLKRLGNKFDGGYLIDERLMGKVDKLISLGVNDDWSFEREFLMANDCPAFCYDGSVSTSVFFKRLLKWLARPWKIKKILWSLKVIVDYQFFFSGTVSHIKKFVGFDNRNGCISMSNLLNEHIKNQNIFLKIDIEGHEYRCLDAILNHQDRIKGLAIEFHNYDLFEDVIIDFISNFQLNVCHVHVNNFGGIQLDGRPVSIEMSFSDEPPLDNLPLSFPHKLDTPNNPLINDLIVTFHKEI